MRKLQQWVRALWMFARVVFRVWDGRRVWPVEAWQIAWTVWLERPRVGYRIWFWSRRWRRVSSGCFSRRADAEAVRASWRRSGYCTAISKELV